MPETFVRITMSVGEAERIHDVLYDAHLDDAAQMFSNAIESGPFVPLSEIVGEVPDAGY